MRFFTSSWDEKQIFNEPIGLPDSDQTQIWFEKNSFSDTNIWVRFDSGNLTQICVWSESGRPMGKYWLGFETDLSLTAFRPKSDSSLENIDSDLRLIWVWQPSDPNQTRVWKILTQIWDRFESDSLRGCGGCSKLAHNVGDDGCGV